MRRVWRDRWRKVEKNKIGGIEEKRERKESEEGMERPMEREKRWRKTK